MDKEVCCPDKVHVQIEYTSKNGVPVESFISTDLDDYVNRKFIHDILDEWMTKRGTGEGPDHFIVFGKSMDAD